jgi:hypothetical protein
LIIQFWRSGNADVFIDAVTFFSAPQAITSPLIWSVPGNNYRGQGVWVRYTDGNQFSDISEASTTPYTISGKTGVGGTTLSFTDGMPQNFITQPDGSYTLSVTNNWSGTVMPSHPCYTFNPVSRTYSNVTVNQTGQDYTPIFSPGPECSVTTGVFRPTNGLLYLKNSEYDWLCRYRH